MKKKKKKKYSPADYAVFKRARDIRHVSRGDESEDKQEDAMSAWEEHG